MISLQKSLLFLSQFVCLFFIHLESYSVDHYSVIFLCLLEAYGPILNFLYNSCGIPEQRIALLPSTSTCWKGIVPSDTPLIRPSIQSEDIISKGRLAEYFKKCKKY